MPFHYPQKIIFRHCDPAGIVFYPRYFEMINDATEAFFDEELGCPWQILHETANIPTVEISTRFSAPSHHGDALIITVDVTKLGRTSLSLAFTASCAGQTRFTAQSTLVRIDKSGQPQPWPDDLRARLTSFMGETA